MNIVEDFFRTVLCVDTSPVIFRRTILFIIKNMPEKEYMQNFWLHAKDTLLLVDSDGICDKICEKYILNPNLRPLIVTQMKKRFPVNAPHYEFWTKFNCSCYGHIAFIQYIALIKYGDLYDDAGWKVIVDIINSDLFAVN